MATNETNTGTLQPKTDQAVAPRGSNSERFTAKVMKDGICSSLQWKRAS